VGLTDRFTGRIAEGRRQKLIDFLGGQLGAGEEILASLPMMQTHFALFGAGYYGVAVTSERVLVVQWGSGVPERIKSLAGEQPRESVAVEGHEDRGKGKWAHGELVLTHAGEPWVRLKVPRIHREDAEAVVRALAG
jgi:hypothetical protein